MFAECLRFRTTMVTTIVVTLIAVGVDVIAPLLAKAAIDHATGVVHDGVGIPVIVVGLVMLAVVRYACFFGRRITAGRLSISVQNTLRLRLLDTLLHLDGRAQQEIRTGQIVSRSITDLQIVQGLLAMAPLSMGAAAQFVIALGIMAALSPLLTAVSLAIIPLVALVIWHTRRKLFAATWSAQQAAADVAGHVEETVTGVRVVKGFGQEERAVDELTELGRGLFARRLRAARINSRFAPTMAAIPQLGMIAVIGVGGYLTMHGHITAGTFLAFSTYVASMMAIARLLTNLVVNAQLARAAAERVFEVTDHPHDPDDQASGTLPDGPLGVHLDNLTFGYGDDDTTTPVLTGIDLDIAPGECLAIVGPPGSGKSTLADLLSRHLRPDTGSISITAADGHHALAGLGADALHSAVSVVFDEPFLYSDSIAANIALGTAVTDPSGRVIVDDPRDDAETALAERIRVAARHADAAEFIESLPDGYATVVGERGLTLSGGQRQRVALARALFADPRILILDDATSAVDAATEGRILRHLRAQHRTMLVLAHRRSTLMLADRVAVIVDGAITDIGTVDELDAQSPHFAALMAAVPTDSQPVSPVPPAAVTTAAVNTAALWPEVSQAPANSDSRRPASSAAPGPARGGRGPGINSALGAMSATPELLAEVAALPPADEEPRVNTVGARREDRNFSLGGLLRPVRWLLLAAIVGITVDTLVGLAFPTLARTVIDAATDADPTMLGWAVIVGVALVGVGWLATALTTITSTRAGERVLYALRVRSYAHLQRLGLDYYERELSGRIMTRMTTDIDALSTFLQTGLSSAIVAVLTIVGVSVALVVTAPTLGLILVPLLPVLVVATVVFRRIAARAYTRSRELVSIVNADFQENIAGIRTTQTYRHTDLAYRRFTARTLDWVDARMTSQRAISVYFPTIGLMSDLATAAAIAIGAHQVSTGQMSAGTLIAFILYLGMLFGPVQQLTQVFDGYQQASVGLVRIADLLRTPSSVAVADHARDPGPLPFVGDVALDGVGFRYRDAPDDALHGIDLHIPPGTSLALVGRTGAGKSTIVKLLARFYDPTSGTVSMDGTDIRDFTLHGYRHRLGLVPQEPHLFTGTVADNIAYGRPDADREAIRAAADAVGATQMIAGLPGRMNHPIGERGKGLSAGQRQLVALARAELVDPDLLLLDEATATLDQATEALVLAAGAAVTHSRTSVIVAHRLATAARADRIAVVEGGTIVESGTHTELLTRDGPYREFWDAGIDPGAEGVEHPDHAF